MAAILSRSRCVYEDEMEYKQTKKKEKKVAC